MAHHITKLPPPTPPVKWALPTTGQALAISLADFEQVAEQLGVETNAIRAVSTVESGGRSGFDKSKRPLIRYETHYFMRLTKGRFNKSHPHLSCAYGTRAYKAAAKNSWASMNEAFALNPDAAVMSASWGMFQIMGEFYAMGNWPSAQRFAEDMFLSAGQHLRLFFGYCRSTKLSRHLKTKSWAAFAKGYNGPKYRDNHYDTQMKAAYDRLSGFVKDRLSPKVGGSRARSPAGSRRRR